MIVLRAFPLRASQFSIEKLRCLFRSAPRETQVTRPAHCACHSLRWRWTPVFESWTATPRARAVVKSYPNSRYLSQDLEQPDSISTSVSSWPSVCLLQEHTDCKMHSTVSPKSNRHGRVQYRARLLLLSPPDSRLNFGSYFTFPSSGSRSQKKTPRSRSRQACQG